MHTFEVLLVLLAVVTLLEAIADRVCAPYRVFLVIGAVALADSTSAHGQLEPGSGLHALVAGGPLLSVVQHMLAGLPRQSSPDRSPGGWMCSLHHGRRRRLTLVPGFSWSVAFVLGAIVAPPNAAAATSIFSRF